MDKEIVINIIINLVVVDRFQQIAIKNPKVISQMVLLCLFFFKTVQFKITDLPT